MLLDFWTGDVTFKWNVLLGLSGGAATKAFGSLVTEPLLQVLGESTRTLAIGMIHGDEGVGDVPGIRGGFRGSVGSAQLRLD